MDKEALAKAAGAALASGALGRILFCRYFPFLFTFFKWPKEITKKS